MVSNIGRFDIYWQYCIGYWGTGYNIDPIISLDVRAHIADIVDVADFTDIDTKIHSAILIPILRF